MAKNQTKEKTDKIVLVAVLKNKRDLDILLAENWYRIPVKYSPKKQYSYLAFYQPAVFGKQGKQIQYYARVLNKQTAKRSALLPKETNHPQAQDDYFKVRVGKIQKLTKPIRNIVPRRVSFGFCALSQLLKSKDILQLYNVAPIEQILGYGLKQAGIKAIPQHYVLGKEKRYCLDFAIFCKKRAIAIECDNKKAHSSPIHRAKDKAKNAFLKKYGWTVIRLKEQEIISNLQDCISKIQKIIQKLM